MKIIKEGGVVWWHGEVVVCPTCQQTVELESGDEDMSNVACQEVDVFYLVCEYCGTGIRHRRNQDVCQIKEG